MGRMPGLPSMATSLYRKCRIYMHIRLYVLYVKSLIGGVPRMGSRVPFALLPFDIYIYLSNKV